MRRFPILAFALSLACLSLVAACTKPGGAYPSLATRPAEAIDPRPQLPSEPSLGTLDAALTRTLDDAVARARGGTAEFNALAAAAERAAAAAGPAQSESWIVAQQALSALVAQNGVTTRAAGDIDATAGSRIEAVRWLVPANRLAIAAAASRVGEINDRQLAVIDRLRDRLAR